VRNLQNLQVKILRSLAIRSIVNESDDDWLQFVEIWSLIDGSGVLHRQVTSDFMSTIASVIHDLRNVDPRISNAWTYLWNTFDRPDFRTLHSELEPIVAVLFRGDVDGAKHLVSRVSGGESLDDIVLSLTYVREFIIDALSIFEMKGAKAIREHFRSQITWSKARNTQVTIARERSAFFTPDCPACGSQTVLRYSRTGLNPNRPFWGCSTFPSCRGTLSLFKSSSSYPQFNRSLEGETRDWFVDFMNDTYGPSWNE
jgi:hypothetical protein